jgi:hypothetical protein
LTIPRVRDQKEQLSSLILDRAISLDFVAPARPDGKKQSKNNPKDDNELKTLVIEQERLMDVGKLRVNGEAWEQV